VILDPQKLQLISGPIAEGHFGVVYKGKYLSTNVALKQIKGDEKELEKELQLIE